MKMLCIIVHLCRRIYVFSGANIDMIIIYKHICVSGVWWSVLRDPAGLPLHPQGRAGGGQEDSAQTLRQHLGVHRGGHQVRLYLRHSQELSMGIQQPTQAPFYFLTKLVMAVQFCIERLACLLAWTLRFPTPLFKVSPRVLAYGISSVEHGVGILFILSCFRHFLQNTTTTENSAIKVNTCKHFILVVISMFVLHEAYEIRN